jgi:hypothetical protein
VVDYEKYFENVVMEWEKVFVVVIGLDYITNMKNELVYKEKLFTIYVDYKGLTLA